MGFFKFIDKVGEKIGKFTDRVTNLVSTAVGPVFGLLGGVLGSIPGFGRTVEGAFGMIKELFKHPLDLLNPKKLLAVLNPQALLHSLGNLRSAVERIIGGYGARTALDLGPKAQENLLHAAQASAWQMATARYAAAA